MLRFYNTLTRKVEEFKPVDPPKVRIYTCGPTVYDFAHIGNLRTYIFEDLLQRVLEINDYKVLRVMNITDIDDKIIQRAKEQNVPIEEITRPFEKAFFGDQGKLNIKSANVYPRATEHIPQMVNYIETLIKKGFAYIEKDGSVYFDISRFSGYGKLSQLDKRQIKSGARVKADEYTKETAEDFALWKSVEPQEVGYDSPWGKGRPGWHIECSVMSQEYLGETFDIHAGGVDLIFPHHENEIAQSEAKTGKPFAIFFIEGEHLLVNGRKMAKSLGNFLTLEDIESKGFDPLDFKYLVLTVHYRQKMNFTWQSLEAARSAFLSLKQEISSWEEPKVDCAEYQEKFLAAVNDDLNIPQALALMWDFVKSSYPTSVKSASLLKMDEVLGLRLRDHLGQALKLPPEVKKLIEEREKLRKEGKWEEADEVRKKIEKEGYLLEDTPSGTQVKSSTR